MTPITTHAPLARAASPSRSVAGPGTSIGALVIAAEQLTPLGRPRPDPRAEILALRISADEGLRKHDEPRARRFADQALRFRDARVGVEQNRSGLDDGNWDGAHTINYGRRQPGVVPVTRSMCAHAVESRAALRKYLPDAV